MNGENELPEGWATAILKDITIDVKNVKPENEPNRVFVYVDISSINNRTYTIEEVKSFFGKDAPSRARRPIKKDDILFSNVRTYLRNISIVPEKYDDQLCSTGFTVLRPSSSILPKYLFYFVLTDSFIEQVSPQQRGSQYPATSDGVVRSVPIPLPPLAEQHRIVAAVEQLLARVNASRERLDRVPGLLKAFRQAVLAAACSGRLTEGWREGHPIQDIREIISQVNVNASKTGRVATDNVIPGVCILSVGNPGTSSPSGWAWVPLLRVARLESGHTPSIKHPEYWEGNIPWIGIQDARTNHGGFIEETHRHVSQSGLNHSAARLLPPNTVCLSRTASVGYVVIMKNQMATSQDFVNWICSEALLPKFLMYALMAEGDDIRRFGRGTTHTTIYFPEVKALHICLPTPPEQHEIVHRVESLFSLADRIEQRVALGKERADRLTQAILAKAFRGGLVPTEAELARKEGREYEPASVLLERIRREREIGEGKKKSVRKGLSE